MMEGQDEDKELGAGAGGGDAMVPSVFASSWERLY